MHVGLYQERHPGILTVSCGEDVRLNDRIYGGLTLDGDCAIVAVIAALAGAIVGGFISEGRNWLQIRREQIHTLNRVLYTQLDVWHTVARADPRRMLLALPRILAGQFGVPENEWQALFQSVKELEVFVAQLVSSSIPKDLEQKYESAVDSLASVDPLLAFRLSGRPGLNNYAEHWRAVAESWLEAQHASPSDHRMLDALKPAFEQETRSSLLQTLEEDLTDVAGAINRSTRRRVEKMVTASKEAPDEKGEAEIAQMITSLIKASIAFMHPPPLES
jgi:hypothetical protein